MRSHYVAHADGLELAVLWSQLSESWDYSPQENVKYFGQIWHLRFIQTLSSTYIFSSTIIPPILSHLLSFIIF